MKNKWYVFRQAGFSLVELMVGLVIGLVAILAVYQILQGVEGTRRTSTSVGEMQVNGVYALFLMGAEVGKAGMPSSANRQFLKEAGCLEDLKNGIPVPVLASRGDIASPLDSFLPEGKADPQSDKLFIFYAEPSVLVLPVNIYAKAAPGADSVSVWSPVKDAFKAQDRVFLLRSGVDKKCFPTKVFSNAAPSAGVTDVTLVDKLDTTFNVGDMVLSLGPAEKISREFFWLGKDGVFRRTLMTDNGSTREDPLLSNVVAFRVQYGVRDTPGLNPVEDSTATKWVNPGDSGWEASALVRDNGRNIKALRVSFVIQADEAERELAGVDFKGQMFVDCGGLESCPDPTDIELSNSGAAVGWRYRIFETVIPLRNNIWN